MDDLTEDTMDRDCSKGESNMSNSAESDSGCGCFSFIIFAIIIILMCRAGCLRSCGVDKINSSDTINNPDKK